MKTILPFFSPAESSGLKITAWRAIRERVAQAPFPDTPPVAVAVGRVRHFHCTLDSALCPLMHPRCTERRLLAVSILSPLAGQALGDPAGKFVFRLLGGGDGGPVDLAGVAEFLECSQGKHADQQVGIVDMLDQ